MTTNSCWHSTPLLTAKLPRIDEKTCDSDGLTASYVRRGIDRPVGNADIPLSDRSFSSGNRRHRETPKREETIVDA